MYFRRLQDLRQDHDMTQKAVAEYLGMHVNVYQRYEGGKRDVPVWVVDKLADLYGVSTDYLLGRTDNPIPPEAAK